MGGYIGTKAVSLSTTSADVTGDADIGGDLTVGADADITGTLTSDAAKIENSTTSTVSISESTGSGTAELRFIATESFPKTKIVTDVSAGSLSLETLGNERLNIANNGDISFYEDTGTTAKFFWDASAESLGIGTTSPNGIISTLETNSVTSVNVNEGAQFSRVNSSGNGQMNFVSLNVSGNGGTNNGWGGIGLVQPTASSNNADLLFFTRGSSIAERMRIDSSGNVGIGTDSPNSVLEVKGSSSGQNILHLSNSAGTSDGGAENQIRVTCNGNTNWGNLDIQAYNTIFTQNGTERMRIDGSGRVGIGATPLTSGNIPNLTIAHTGHGLGLGYQGATLPSAAGIYTSSSTNFGQAYGSLVVQSRTDYSGYSIIFRNNGGEAARIDSSGNLLVGTTSANFSAKQFVVSTTNAIAGQTTAAANTYEAFVGARNGNAGKIATWWYNASSQVGHISITASATSYNTSSDHRLKENVTDVTDGITRVKQLAPKRFNFIADPDATVDGFLAHEAQTVVPEAVTGTHNETQAIGDITDGDGNTVETGVVEPDTLEEGHTWTETGTQPVYQGIDQAKLVPLLTAALQEAIAKIETLETEMTSVKSRLDALEASE